MWINLPERGELSPVPLFYPQIFALSTLKRPAPSNRSEGRALPTSFPRRAVEIHPPDDAHIFYRSQHPAYIRHYFSVCLRFSTYPQPLLLLLFLLILHRHINFIARASAAALPGGVISCQARGGLLRRPDGLLAKTFLNVLNVFASSSTAPRRPSFRKKRREFLRSGAKQSSPQREGDGLLHRPGGLLATTSLNVFASGAKQSPGRREGDCFVGLAASSQGH